MTEGKHTSRGPRLSHQEIRQRKVQKDGSGCRMENLPKHTEKSSEAKASKRQGDKKPKKSRHRSSSPEKDRRSCRRSSTSERSDWSQRHRRHRDHRSSSASTDESRDRWEQRRKYKQKSHRHRKSSESSASSPHVSRRDVRGSRHKRNVSHVSSSESSSSESDESGGKHSRNRWMPPFPKLPVFDGKAVEWRGFIFQFRKLAKSGRWQCRRRETSCWNVCEGRPSPMCRVAQRQNEGIMMPWRISSIKGMGSWSCQLQLDDICSQWGKKRLKAWMTLLTVC